MAGLGPEATDRAADMACANHADFQLGSWGGLTRGGRRLEYRLEDDRARGTYQCAATAINSDLIEHQHTNCELQPVESCPPDKPQNGYKSSPGIGARRELIPLNSGGLRRIYLGAVDGAAFVFGSEGRAGTSSFTLHCAT
jgi:hypothetical protein